VADTLTFKTRSRRDDPFGHKTVELNLDDLLAAYNTFVQKFASGSVSVPAGQTTLNVAHTSVGSIHAVTVTPTGDPGGRWWISGKTATGFTINLQVAAPAGGVGFDYFVKGA
jgi:hypothetical protein